MMREFIFNRARDAKEAENERKPCGSPRDRFNGAHYETNLKYNSILIRSGAPSIFASFFDQQGNLIKVIFFRAWGEGFGYNSRINKFALIMPGKIPDWNTVVMDTKTVRGRLRIFDKKA